MSIVTGKQFAGAPLSNLENPPIRTFAREISAIVFQ
jgi:hypothetical protein